MDANDQDIVEDNLKPADALKRLVGDELATKIMEVCDRYRELFQGVLLDTFPKALKNLQRDLAAIYKDHPAPSDSRAKAANEVALTMQMEDITCELLTLAATTAVQKQVLESDFVHHAAQHFERAVDIHIQAESFVLLDMAASMADDAPDSSRTKN